MSSSAFAGRFDYPLRIGAGVLFLILFFFVASGSQRPHRTDAFLQPGDLADESTCATCHSEADTYPQTGHAQTLRPASAPESFARLQRLSDVDPNIQVNLDPEGEVVVSIEEDGVTRKMQLDWCFGSGAHAQTWTATMPDLFGGIDKVEFRWSWFHEIDSFARTPAQPDTVGPTHFSKFGLLFDGPKALRCFSCHASHLPTQWNPSTRSAHFDSKHIVMGISCQRCHGPQGPHVASDGDVIVDLWDPKDRMEAISQCGRCHRNADEQAAGSIHADNTDIARFQPVGLVQSKCFTASQMTCTTCHDPHKSLAAQDSLGIWQCVQCHNPESDHDVLCGDGKRDACLQCHMPKVGMKDPVKFTDHWIRVRPEMDDN